jgi:signal recognition particle receptor subunit beta
MILHQYKVVFAGTMGAGKSEAIKSLSSIDVVSTEAVNTDTQSHSKMFTTVGIDYGELILEDGTKVGLYGTPGQERFDFIWNMICKGALGTIILIDNSVDHPIEQLNFYLDYFKTVSDNIIIGITHLDIKSANHAAIYRDWEKSQTDARYPLFFVDARERNDVLLLLEALIANAEAQFSI